MSRLAVRLLNDDAGFIVSAELILVATVGILTMIVGLSEVAHNINNELEDIGSAFGNMTQTYQFNGTSGHKGSADGSSFYDVTDYCDNYCDIVSVTPTGEQ
jgi:hypothetical protein